MEKLPPEIALEIFYRLSPKSVVRCKFVCKSWRSLLPCGDDGNYFANMHLRRRRHHQQCNLDDYSTSNCIALKVFKDNDQKEEGSLVSEFHITKYNEVEGLHCTVKRLTFSQICNISGWLMDTTTLVGSCNGLVCLITFRRVGTYSFKTRIRICNPLLHEYVTLPHSDLQFKQQYTRVINGFGHNPITDEYKVVSVYYRKQYPGYIGDVEVYTLGKSTSSNGGAAGMWRRSKGSTIKYKLWSRPRPMLINGSIHWLAEAESKQDIIVSFDLEDEEFRVIPLPSNLNRTNTLPIKQFLELRGCLCLIVETRDDQNRNLDVWVLLKDYMNKESWVKEFSIKCNKWRDSGLRCLYVAAIKKNKKDGDAILCWCLSKSGIRLDSYDPKTQKFEKVRGRQVDVNGWIFNSVLHINSLVSLKALGEKTQNMQQINSLDKALGQACC